MTTSPAVTLSAVAVLNAMPEAALLIQLRDGAIVHANALALRMFGHEPSGVLGFPIGMLVPERLRSSYLASLRQHADVLLGNREADLSRPLSLLGRDATGHDLPVEVRVGLLPPPSPSQRLPVYAVVTLRVRVPLPDQRTMEAASNADGLLDGTVLDISHDALIIRTLGDGRHARLEPWRGGRLWLDEIRCNDAPCPRPVAHRGRSAAT